MGKVIVIGSSNTDMVFVTSKMPAPGETVMGNSFDMIPGGKGANQAVAAARAGAEVTFAAKVGADDLGKKAIMGYQNDRINTSPIFIDNQTPSGVAMILVDESSGQNSIVVAPGANAKLSKEEILQLEPSIKEAAVLLIQLEIPLETVEVALQIARKNGVKTILNPAPARNLSAEILSLVDIITPNETEAQILTGTYPEEDTQTREAAHQLLAQVSESVIITLGEKGAYFCSKNGEEGFIPTISVKAVDTTAAGDVFNGYLAAALAEGLDYNAAIRQANHAASLSVTQKGAQPSIPLKAQLKNAQP